MHVGECGGVVEGGRRGGGDGAECGVVVVSLFSFTLCN